MERLIVTVNRLQVFEDEDIPEGDITGFTIADNGIGFDGPNFESFLRADSQHKEARGGKGVDRFCWLKAFDHVPLRALMSRTINTTLGSLSSAPTPKVSKTR